MKERLNRIVFIFKVIWVFISFVLLICIAPAWLIYWVITGWSWGDWANKFLDPEWWEEMDRIRKDTDDRVAEIKKFMQEITEAVNKRNDLDT